MRPRKKGQQYEICYRCPGYTKPIYERFPTYEAANLRVAQIEYEKSIGEFRPPKQTPIQTKRAQKKFITVSELLDEYVQVYGLNHWGDSFLSCNIHRIEHYIKPYLGNVAVKDLTTHDLDLFYDSLQDKPAVVLKGHKKTDACVSRSVIEKTHALLRSALNQAVIWEYIPSNPALRVTLPKYQPQERTVWSASEAQQALDSCTDPVLKLCMLLALGLRRNRSCADHKGTETLPEGQPCSTGKARALHCPADIPRVEADRLLYLAGAESPKNGEQCAKGVSAENRGAGTGGRKRAAARDKGNVGRRLSRL